MRPRPIGTVTVGPAPQAPNARRFPLPMIILPVVMGAAVVALTGNIAFLAFGLLGPLMAGWNWYDDRRSGRKQHRAQVAKFDADLEAARARARSKHGDSAWSGWRCQRPRPTNSSSGSSL